MGTPDCYRWLVGKPKLLSMVIHFNCQLLEHIDPQRLQALSPLWTLPAMRSSARGRSRVNQEVVTRFQLPSNGFYDFAPVHRRFALLPMETLAELLLYTGTAVFHSSFSRMVTKSERRALKEGLGEPLFEFAIRRTTFLRSLSPEMPTSETISRQSLRQAGWQLLAGTLMQDSKQLLQRLQLKLPQDLTDQTVVPMDTERRGMTVKLLKKVLLKEVAPEYETCF